MRKNLFWSLFAATAILTACNDDNVVSTDNITPEGEKVGVNFTVNIGKPMGTYATESENGAWSNFKKDETMKEQYNRRAVLQVYQQGATAYMDEQRMLVADDIQEDVINFANLRLAPGATYTAVVWVDFIAGDSNDPKTDLYYNTQNLDNISMLGQAGDVAQKLDPEGRDAYTAAVTFTLATDGKYNIDGDDNTPQEITTAIPLTAKRPFGKVRIVMTDKANKTEWERYFSANSNSRILNYVALGITGLNTGYNALTQDVKPKTTADFQFHHAYNSEITDGMTFWSQNNIKWVDESGKSATTQADAKYPVLDYNYFLPARKATAASYDLDIKMFDMPIEGFEAALEAALKATGTTAEGATDDNGLALTWACISHRRLSGIPVKTNCLTTIKGNFLTYGYKFTVIVEDLFDGNNEETITVDDEGDNTRWVETKEIGKATVTITKDPESGAAKTIVVNGMDADAKDKIAELIETFEHKDVDLTLDNVAADVNTIEWPTIALKSVTVNVASVLDAATSMKFSAETVAINSTAEKQTKPITVRNTNMEGAINLNGNEYATVSTLAKTVTVETGKYDALIANGEVVDNSLTVNNGATITALSSNCITITLDGTTVTHDGQEADAKTSLNLTHVTKMKQTLVIKGNPICIPQSITVKAVQFIDLQEDGSGVWNAESEKTEKWIVLGTP